MGAPGLLGESTRKPPDSPRLAGAVNFPVSVETLK